MTKVKCVLLGILFSVAFGYGFAQEESVDASSFEGTETLEQAKATMSQKYQYLKDSMANNATDSVVYLDLNDDDIYELKVASDQEQVGISRSLDVDVNLKPTLSWSGKKPLDMGFGSALRRGEATVWTGVVQSMDATALRLHLTDFDLPEGVEVYVFDDFGQAFGPYTGKGPTNKGAFWTSLTFGDLLWLQVHVPEGVSTPVSFKISDVGHFGDRFFLGQNKTSTSSGKSCESGGVDSCVENATCYSGTLVENAMQAVAHILYKSDSGGWFMCSGALINDTDTTTNYPYFLTANHCISSQSEAESLEAYFDFTAKNCGSLTSSCSSKLSSANRVSGASLMASGSASEGDYALLKLDKFPSGTSYSLGWTSSDYSDNDGQTIYRISHPNGYPQAYSTSVIDSSISICGDRTRPTYIWSEREVGGNMGGSSGAPTFNSSGKIVGQLRGTCTADTECSADSRVLDGSFHHSFWRNLRPFLYPTAMHVEYITVTETEVNTNSYKVDVAIRVVDSRGVPVSNALVQATLSGPMNQLMIGISDSDGVVSMTAATPISGTWSACTTNLVRPGLTMSWDPSADEQSCGSN